MINAHRREGQCASSVCFAVYPPSSSSLRPGDLDGAALGSGVEEGFGVDVGFGDGDVGGVVVFGSTVSLSVI